MARFRLPVELKDIKADSNYREELIAWGGKKQVPYLIDPDRGEAMYESEKIIKYLEKYYSQESVADSDQVRLSRLGQTCDVEE